MDSNMLRQVQDMQRRADELQKGLASIEVEGVAGGGLVRVTVNGLGELKKVSLDPSLLKSEERQVVEDLVVAAAADGKAKMEARRFQDMDFLQNLMKSFGAGSSDTD